MIQDQTLREFLQKASTIAIVGAKDKEGSPVDRVGRYLMRSGYTVLPVHPARASVWGLPAVKTLALLPAVPDAVCLFRAAEYCPGHAREVLALPGKPLLFWMQLGISSPEAARILEDTSIAIVEDRCLMVEHKRLFGPLPAPTAMAERRADAMLRVPARDHNAPPSLRKSAAAPSQEAPDAPPAGEEVFRCRRCGHCCRGEGGIVVGPGDLPRLSAHFQIQDQEFFSRYTETRSGKQVLATGADGFCVFFRSGSGCCIHEARPDICRAWPYFRGNLVDEISFRMAREDCPGISAKTGHGCFAREGYRYLREHGLLATDKSREGRALIVREEELPPQSEGGALSPSSPEGSGR